VHRGRNCGHKGRLCRKVGQEASDNLREGGRSNTSTSGEASEEVVQVEEVDRRGVGLDDIASSIASVLHHGHEEKGMLGGALVKKEKVQQRGLSALKLEEVG
jgi:hypothetical protein